MDFELDHVFVCVGEGGPEASRLASCGLSEGEPNTHPGQGTACRRFVFANAFLELLWVCDAEEARSETPRPLRLWERWSGRSALACPFGLCLRPARPDVGGPPFASWRYQPPYLPAPLCIHVGEDCSSVEGPLLLYLAFGRRPDSRPPPHPPPHRAGFREITSVLVRGPQAPSSAARDAARQAGGVAFGPGESHLLEIGFDGEGQGRTIDLRPQLPLLLRW